MECLQCLHNIAEQAWEPGYQQGALCSTHPRSEIRMTIFGSSYTYLYPCLGTGTMPLCHYATMPSPYGTATYYRIKMSETCDNGLRTMGWYQLMGLLPKRSVRASASCQVKIWSIQLTVDSVIRVASNIKGLKPSESVKWRCSLAIVLLTSVPTCYYSVGQRKTPVPLRFSGWTQICPGLQVIRRMKTSISFTKCPLTLYSSSISLVMMNTDH